MRTQRQYALAILIAGVLLCSSVVLAGMLGFRLNLTPSFPRGLWRIVPKPSAYEVGDIVFVCPPNEVLFALARSRGYLPRGSCPGSSAPLIKSIAAIAGQRTELGSDVRIDGKPVAHSTIRLTDAEGRALPRWPGGIVPQGRVFLLAPKIHSFDSRYFGPVPANGILGLAHPVLVHAS